MEEEAAVTPSSSLPPVEAPAEEEQVTTEQGSTNIIEVMNLLLFQLNASPFLFFDPSSQLFLFDPFRLLMMIASLHLRSLRRFPALISRLRFFF